MTFHERTENRPDQTFNPGSDETENREREIVDWVDASRDGWDCGIVESENHEERQIEDYDRRNLTLGCLVRIADALEALSGKPTTEPTGHTTPAQFERRLNQIFDQIVARAQRRTHLDEPLEQVPEQTKCDKLTHRKGR